MNFVLFVGEFIRKLWIYVIKQMDEVFEIFTRFKMLVEKWSENNIKILRIDGGGEYTSKMFEELYAKHGINHEVTSLYMP